MQLPDINVWLALCDTGHVHHAKATVWRQGLPTGEMLYYCRTTQMGFLRLSSNPQVTVSQPLTMADAWLEYDGFRAEPTVDFAEEPIGLEPLWRSLTSNRSFSHKVWNDAYLAAFAITGGYELVTFDQGFTQYRPAGLNCTILT